MTTISAKHPSARTTDSSSPYPFLASPLLLGPVRLKNRMVMGSIHTRLENEENGIDKLAAFYAARARGGAAMIISGAVSPSFEGRVEEDGLVLDSIEALKEHKPIVDAVHAAGSLMIMQILHAGIYAKHDQLVGPGNTPSPINRRVPRALSTAEVGQTIEDFVRCAELAAQAGYDGVEIMGSEGYLINQFTALRTNQRTDDWGGSLENRLRMPVEIVRRVRERMGTGFLILYRISAIDLVEGGLTAHEIDALAQAVEQAGADALNTGIGWHESVVPTIATSVPRGAFAFAAARLKRKSRIPIIASNRINMPDVAESILSSGSADLVSMARPFLADADFAVKAVAGRADDINTCIACNQACLDHIFTNRLASCLVNPMACHETEFDPHPPAVLRKVAVVGSGPAGLACAATAAERGHTVVLYEASGELGGQLNLARRVPGKEQEFAELLRYFRRRLNNGHVTVRLNERADTEALAKEGFDHVVIATGIRPRMPDIEGIDHPKVLGYMDVILGKVSPGDRVAVIGTGGIGHDVGELLTAQPHDDDAVEEFLVTWGVDPSIESPGGLVSPKQETPKRTVTLFQRGETRPGARLGKSTGWIHRTKLTRRGVDTITGCTYQRIDHEGLHYSVAGEPRLFQADHVVICAGQDPERELADKLQRLGVHVDLIGGARFASELDAKRAIDEGTRLAYSF
ncbi:MAG: NADPH-dependent 2,4-dienoyl-CoA reductase [Ottowia sp.]|uniref:oxidoreductase n=1 Tax=Ottowia sp. TaxID=1898956 RepID=UPI003C72AD96